MSKIYEIDPEADTLVVVHPLAESFAPWPEHDNKSTTIPTQHLTNGYRNGAVVPVPAPAGVRIKVSSKHLSLASPRFRDILAQKTAAAANTNGSGKQSNGVTTPPASPNSLWRKQAATTTATDESDGRIHIVLDGLDADATTTVLNIVHGRGGKDRVPKTVSLEALARIAVVVDKLKLQDAVEIYADRWVDELHSKSAPSSKDSSRDLVFWIYVAYVFQRDRIFKEATKIAAAQLTGPLPTLPNLPLRAKIAHDIDTQRQAVIGQALDILETAVDKLVQGDLDQDEETTATDGEDNNSDTFLLGTLLRTLHRHKLIWPRPPSPYAGVSIAAISHVAHDVQTRAWRTAFRIGDSTRNNCTNNQLLLTPQLDNLRAGVVGLALKSDLGYNLYYGRDNEDGGDGDEANNGRESSGVVVVVHRERERAFEGSEPGLEVIKQDDRDVEGAANIAAELATELATDDDNSTGGETEHADGDDMDSGDVNDGANCDEIGVVDATDEVNERNEDVDDYVSEADSEADVTLVDDGSFEQRQVQPLYEMPSDATDKRRLVEPLGGDELLLPCETAHDTVVLPARMVLDSKLDTTLDRVLVSLSLCASLAVMEWVPQLLHPGSMKHWGRWMAVLLLLVWIPAVH